jgi:hypothetical protein
MQNIVSVAVTILFLGRFGYFFVLGVYAQLDARFLQSDEPRSLHIIMVTPDKLRLLQDHDENYQYSIRN